MGSFQEILKWHGPLPKFWAETDKRSENGERPVKLARWLTKQLVRVRSPIGGLMSCLRVLRLWWKQALHGFPFRGL